jgi:Transglycosylase SLT domain
MRYLPLFPLLAALMLFALAVRTGHAQEAPSYQDQVVECIIWRESRDDPYAVNPRSGAAGLGQFLYSTWLTTPDGQAGYSRFDPDANREMVYWMLDQGRGGEFATYWGCA